jgi:nitroreductase|tara:strand:- start:1670 stop:2200 length:531 start_codon:yes stop_codon:yes gene_type:complete
MSSNDFIYKRKSSVSFSPQKISSQMIKDIIDASMWAPSSRNAQPWRIIGVENGTENFNKIIFALSTGNQIWAKNAGLILVFASNIIDDDFNPKIFLDIGFSGQNAMLRATELNLETHPIGGWDEELVKHAISIPDKSKVAFLLVVGHKANSSEMPKERTRDKMEDHFSLEKWGENF